MKTYFGLIAAIKKAQAEINRTIAEDPETYRKAVVDIWEEKQREADENRGHASKRL